MLPHKSGRQLYSYHLCSQLLVEFCIHVFMNSDYCFDSVSPTPTSLVFPQASQWNEGTNANPPPEETLLRNKPILVTELNI